MPQDSFGVTILAKCYRGHTFVVLVATIWVLPDIIETNEVNPYCQSTSREAPYLILFKGIKLN